MLTDAQRAAMAQAFALALQDRVTVEEPVGSVDGAGYPAVTWTTRASNAPARLDPLNIQLADVLGGKPTVAQRYRLTVYGDCPLDVGWRVTRGADVFSVAAAHTEHTGRVFNRAEVVLEG